MDEIKKEMHYLYWERVGIIEDGGVKSSQAHQEARKDCFAAYKGQLSVSTINKMIEEIKTEKCN